MTHHRSGTHYENRLMQLKIAIVHEWLESYSGSERVLEQLLHCFPQAQLYAVVDFMPPEERAFLGGREVKTSFIQKLPFARKIFRNYLGLMPLAIEQLDLSGFDLIISSSHAVAKGVLTGPNQIHISYVHSPMRYAWDLQHQYLRQANLTRGLKSYYVRWLLSRLRQWDVRTAPSVDTFVANSSYIARRIGKVYGRDAQVIHPPVDTTAFELCSNKSDFYFVVSRQVPYKRIDLIAAAFAKMPHRKLLIVGDGPEHQRVVAAAEGAPNIEIHGAVSHEKLCEFLQRARALVVAAEEDFGITMVEAQACGTPVISFARGGATDIILAAGPAPTGVLFEEQTPDSIVDAVEAFEARRSNFSPTECRKNALRFSIDVFRSRVTALVETTMQRQRFDETYSRDAEEHRSVNSARHRARTE